MYRASADIVGSPLMPSPCAPPLVTVTRVVVCPSETPAASVHTHVATPIMERDIRGAFSGHLVLGRRGGSGIVVNGTGMPIGAARLRGSTQTRAGIEL